MDDTAPSAASPRFGQVIALYRRVLRRYRKIETLTGRAVQTLRAGCEVREVNAALDRKRILLQQIREEEDNMIGAGWWKRSRPGWSLEECRELLFVFEAIGKTVEGAIAQEDECRALLKERIAGRPDCRSPRHPKIASGRSDRAPDILLEEAR